MSTDSARRRVLVVATAPCTGEAADRVAELVGTDGEAVVVAATPASPLNYWANDQRARERAAKRLAGAIASLAERGVAATGEIGDDDPLQALDDAVVVHRPDAAILLTPVAGEAGWLELGVVHAARERFALPVEHVAVAGTRVVDDPAARVAVVRAHPRRDLVLVSVLGFLAALGSAVWFVGPAVGAVPEWALVLWAVVFDIVPKTVFFYLVWRLYLRRRYGDRLAAPATG